jgi:hypothetical protein
LNGYPNKIEVADKSYYISAGDGDGFSRATFQNRMASERQDYNKQRSSQLDALLDKQIAENQKFVSAAAEAKNLSSWVRIPPMAAFRDWPLFQGKIRGFDTP